MRRRFHFKEESRRKMKKMKNPPYDLCCRSKRCQALSTRGFSLIEVTIALGIVAAVLVPLMAMLPESVKTMRDATDLTTSSRILEEVMNEAQMTDYSDLQRFANRERYYDEQGNDITNTYNQYAELHHYTARIRISGQQGVEPAALPGDRSLIRSVASTVKVDVAVTRGDRTFNFDDDNNKRDIISFAGVVADISDR